MTGDIETTAVVLALLTDNIGNHDIITPQIRCSQLGQAQTAAGRPVDQFTLVMPFDN